MRPVQCSGMRRLVVLGAEAAVDKSDKAAELGEEEQKLEEAAAEPDEKEKKMEDAAQEAERNSNTGFTTRTCSKMPRVWGAVLAFCLALAGLSSGSWNTNRPKGSWERSFARPAAAM